MAKLKEALNKLAFSLALIELAEDNRGICSDAATELFERWF